MKSALGENARQYGYDLVGRMVMCADAANRVRTYTYDAAGQNTAIQFPDGRIATYGHDVLGRRTTMSDWGGLSTYTFDARGQMSGKTASGYVQSYDYDANGNRTTLTLAGVGSITYVFDDLNRLTSAQKPTGERYTMMYDVDSRRTTMQLGNGTTRAYSYDANSRLTTQIELNGATPLVTIVDGYDPVGNRIGRNLDGVLTTWTYDDLYRLTHQDKPGQVCTYVLDPVGNLEVMWEASANPKTFTFDAADRLVTMVEGSQTTTYTYTAFGALETEVTTGIRVTNTYDGMDQLVKVHRTVLITPFISTYTFDGDGLRRTAQEGNVQPTTMVWDGSDYLFLDGPSSDQLVLTLGGEVVSSGTRDLLTDPLGSLVREITAGATLSGQFQFYPFGMDVSGNPAAQQPFTYLAREQSFKDSAARQYWRGRNIDKATGTYAQLGMFMAGSKSPYRFGKPNPLRQLDRRNGDEPVHDPDDLHEGGIITDPCYNACHLEYLDDLDDCAEAYWKCMRWLWWTRVCDAKYIICLTKARVDLWFCGDCCNWSEDWMVDCFDCPPKAPGPWPDDLDVAPMQQML